MKLSYSSIRKLMQCPRQWKFKYIDHVPETMTANLVIGRVYDKTVSYLLNCEIASEGSSKDVDIPQVFSSFWDLETKGKRTLFDDPEENNDIVIEWKDKDPMELKQKGIEMAERYRKDVLPSYKPLEVQKRIEFNVDDIVVIAIVDAIMVERPVTNNRQSVIVDQKWREKSFSTNELQNDQQSSFYTLATGIDTTEFHCAINLKKPKLDICRVYRTGDSTGWTQELIREANSIIQNGAFPPNPFNPMCNFESCPYYTHCKTPWL